MKRIRQLLSGKAGWVLRIVITIGLFALLFVLIDMREMVDYLRQVLIGWLLVATLVKLVGIGAAIVRWDLLLRAQGIRVPFPHLMGSFMVGRFIGMFLPSTIGLDTYRAYDIAQHAKDAIGSVAVILVEKVTGFFTLSLLVLVTLPAGRRFVPDIVLIIVGAAFCAPVVLAFLLLLRPKLFERVLRWDLPFKNRVEGKLREAIAAISAYKDQQGYLWLAVALGLVVHGATAWMYYFSARAVQVEASMADMLFVGPLIIVATVIGPVIAGLGAREGTAVGLLTQVGVPETAAALVGHLGFWTAEAVPALIGGLVLALRPDSYRPAIEHARRPSAAPGAETPAAPREPGPQPSLWSDGLLPGLGAGALAGLLVGLIEIAVLALSMGSSSDLRALPYAAILYGLIGLLGGAGLGLIFYLIARRARPKRPAAILSRWSFGLVFVGLAALVARYRIIRDVFQEHLRTFSAVGLLVHAGLGLAALVLLALLLWALRRLQRGRAGGWLVHWGNPILALVLLAGALLVALLLRPAGAPPSTGIIPTSLQDKPNVILIGVDTLRADRLACYGYNEPNSPHMDTLAADGVLYQNMLAQSSWTKPSFATIFTSLYPSSHTAIYKSSRLPQGALTLAEVLHMAGYRTGGLANNINVAPSFGFDQGFDEYNFLEPGYPLGADASSSQLAFYQLLRRAYFRFAGERVVVEHFYQDAQTMTDQALQWLEGHQDERFYLFLHYMDPHDPYMEHPYSGLGYARAENQDPDPAMAETFSQLYDGEIRYLDGHLGRLFDWLRQAGLYENTLIILTGDHGEEFQEHGGWWHGLTLYGEQVEVPLIVKYPGGARAGTLEGEFARSLDIAPTVLDVLGLPLPESWQGRSLWSETEAPTYVFAEEDHEGNIIHMVQQGEHKWIRANEGNPRGLPTQELFDLAADPHEQHNLVATESQAEQTELDDTMNTLLESAIVKAAANRVAAEAGELDAATEEQLRNLGY
ncbi:MAG: flippase-like domain-containing protein [Chloroflexia bacterium]|nr:flippase-like domain-containing protein [Chloroflexia bacterium]